ncbi:PEP-CTERM sorting domain-containing protein [Azohydromonas australica]|uniref:PEP-CTERM sorting domain-containing protein n=1 Tax=Azohydromonas australica TaxID=364039 RepID=UPI0003F9834F|nr:PEP-CTERM sorting domain-containing protein [Azohydromonas australica]
MFKASVSRAVPWLCAALVASTAAGPAWADARALLVLEDFGWSLVDLRPGDGIAPGVSFDTSRINARAAAWVQQSYAGPDGQPLPYPTDVRSRYVGLQQFFPRAAINATPGLGSAGVSQGNDARDFEARVGGLVRNTAGDGVLENRFDARTVPASSSFVGAIVLAPYTRLVWTGDLRMELETTGGPRHEGGLAAFHMRMLGADGRRLGGYSTRLDTDGAEPGLLVREQTLSFSISNPRGTSLASTIEASMRASGYTSLHPAFAPAVAAVPEPGAVGLMLAGVGVVGIVARRRKSPCPQGSAG